MSFMFLQCSLQASCMHLVHALRTTLGKNNMGGVVYVGVAWLHTARYGDFVPQATYTQRLKALSSYMVVGFAAASPQRCKCQLHVLRWHIQHHVIKGQKCLRH